nr:hypothetical protein [Tanacetum cinerariifolium]
VATKGLEAANRITWTEIKKLMTEEFCPDEEIQLMELELWNLKGTTISSRPASLNEAVRMTYALMEQKAQARAERIAEGNKRRWESSQGGNNSNNKNNYRDNTRHHQQNNQRQGNVRTMTTSQNEVLNTEDHHLLVTVVWYVTMVVTRLSAISVEKCKEKGHTRNHFLKRNNQQGEEARGCVYMIKDAEKQQGPNVVTVEQDAIIVCSKKFVHIPVKNKTLVVEGDREQKEKCWEDVPVIQDFPEVFPDDLLGLPLPRKLEFRIKLVPSDVPVMRAPYRLAPSRMMELADLQELLKKGFIHPSSSSLEPLILFEDIRITAFRTRYNHYEFQEEEAFQQLKQKLCCAPISVLPEGTEDFIVYYDASLKGFGAVLMQREKKELSMRQRRRIELLNDYDYEIRYHLGEMYVVAGAFSQKKREPLRVRALVRTVHPNLPKKIRNAQSEAMKKKNVKAESLGRTLSGYDSIWVIVHRLTKSGHFLPVKMTDSMEKLTQIYLKENVCRHGVPISIISDRDSKFASRFWRSLQRALGTQLDMSTAYHPESDGQSKRTIQTLEDILRACAIDFRGSWDRQLPLVEFSSNNSYHASIKAAPPFKVLERVGLVAYKLELPRELQGIHNTFHVSNLKNCLSDESLIIPLDEIQLDDKLHFIEEPVEIMDHEVKQLKQSRLPIVKVRWRSRRGPEYT